METNDKRSFFEKQYLRLYKKLYYCALAVLCSENDAGEAVREGVLATYAVYSGNCTTKEFDVKIFSALAETAEKFRRNKGFSRDGEIGKADVPQVLAELEKISHKERLCLALNGISGLSVADIADITAMKRLEVRGDISVGRDRLKKSGLKGFKRGVLIKGQEDMFPIPEKLLPENIGEMLDNGSMEITAAVMEAANKEQSTVRSHSNIPKIAAAAAVVIAIGGTGLMLRGGKVHQKSKKSEKVITQEEKNDDLGFVGLRRGSYKSLHTFLCENDTQSWLYLDNTADTQYIDDRSYADIDTSYSMSYFFRDKCLYEGDGDITLLKNSGNSKKERKSLRRFLQENDKVFDAGATSIKSCKLDKGKAEFSEHDMMSDTFIRKDLAENQVYKENGTEPGPYVIGMMLNGDELIALYDFHKPEFIGDKTINQEYCGFSVFDKNSEELLYEYEQPGIMEDLIIGDNGRITVISKYSVGKKAAEAEMYDSGKPAFLPETYENGEASLIDEDDIYISARAEMPVLTIMSSIDTSGEIKCTDKMALTAASSKMLEKGSEIWIASRCGGNGENAMQIIKIDISAGVEIKAFGDIPDDVAIAFDYEYDIGSFTTEDYIDTFSVENGVLYIAGSEYAAAFDEKLNYLGQYKRTVYFDKPEMDNDMWFNDINAAAFDGSTVYFANWLYDDDGGEDVLVLESADLSDINSPKVTSYKEDTLSAPVAIAGRGYGDYLNLDDKCLNLKKSSYDKEDYDAAMELVSLRPEDVVEGKVSRYVYKPTWEEETEISVDDIEKVPVDEMPIRRPVVLSRLEDLKFDFYDITYSQMDGKYCCFPLEPEFDYDADEISRNEYYQYLTDGEDDKVGAGYDDDDNQVYYYYNSKTAKQNYILIEIDGDELKMLGTTPFAAKDVDDLYGYPYLDVDGFVVYDDYLYIISSQSLYDSCSLKDIKK